MWKLTADFTVASGFSVEVAMLISEYSEVFFTERYPFDPNKSLFNLIDIGYQLYLTL